MELSEDFVFVFIQFCLDELGLGIFNVDQEWRVLKLKIEGRVKVIRFLRRQEGMDLDKRRIKVLGFFNKIVGKNERMRIDLMIEYIRKF